jgi:VIT1/CCC1 family predicted Fe2+/Mn2+ transporter
MSALDLQPDEPHSPGLAARLNWLRAGVLGANDGIVSEAGIVVGVAAATTTLSAIATAGIAGLVAGAMSMAVGEYVSVSSQRDSEKALLALERHELLTMPDEEFEELVGLHVQTGLSPELARRVAEEQTAHDALAAHARLELGISPDELTNPWHAAVASMTAFILGGLLPVLVICLTPPAWRIVLTFAAVLLALAGTGSVSARLGRAPRLRAILRNLLGGSLAMVITYGVGALVGHIF